MARGLSGRFAEAVSEEFARQPLHQGEPLSAAHLDRLPDPVVRYVVASGSVGLPPPQNVRVEFDAVMRRRPGQKGMAARSVQHNFFGRPARLFHMRATMLGLPVQALHLYREEAATFQVRVASVKDMVDQSGEQISAAETVTLLNDWCFLAPGGLVDDRLHWSSVDDRSAAVTFSNGPYRVSATLIFNERDELIDFWTDDRPDTSTGEVRPMRWSTPIGGYRAIAGLRLPTTGATVYAYPDGPFTYGEFQLRSIAFDLSSPA